MIAQRRKHLVTSRRRVEDEGEEDAGSEAAPLEDDSLSEATALSDLDDEDADAEGSDISEQDDGEETPRSAKEAPGNGHIAAVNGKTREQPEKESAGSNHVPAGGRGDTEAMMNGLPKPQRTEEMEEIEFEDMGENGSELPAVPVKEEETEVQSSTRKTEAPHERRRREQEEYKRKRDADPTFVPNRGGFFMHDHRHAGPAANGFRPFGRGRGRGQNGGPLVHSSQLAHQTEPMSGPWSHDLHDAVARDDPSVPRDGVPPKMLHSNNGSRTISSASKAAPSNRSFSKTTHISNVQIRVFLPSMRDPITFSGVPVKQHTRLPQHRPPLRRDKPVRVFLPATSPRYIFPSVERSFIFIPRALRPNQQGYGRAPGRGGLGLYRGPSSRRTSTYGGSWNSPSVPMSRRSSLAHEVARDSITPRSGSTSSRPPAVMAEPSKPVVRLPPSNQQPPPSAGDVGPYPPTTFVPATMHRGDALETQAPQPAQHPAYRENRMAALPMHQPRPQKTVSVAGIESPERMSFPPPQQQQQQPFHQQVPREVNDGHLPHDGSYHPHSRDGSHPSQPSAGTPLSQIPERAIHAQPFQPHYLPGPAPAPFYASAPNALYYPPPSESRAMPYGPTITNSAASAPVFIPGQPRGPYVVATATPPAGPSGTLAQESNGMVYYYDASQVYGYAAPNYAVAPPAGVVSIGSVMAASPEGYYYPAAGPGTIYYGA